MARSLSILSTERLALRPLRTDDEEFLASIDSDPRVMQHIGDGVLSTASALHKAKLEIRAAQFRLHFGKWLIELNGGDTRIGWIEIAKYHGPPIDASLNDDLQIGYQLAPEYWRLGYATEAVQTVVCHAFNTLQLWRLIAYARVENHRSVRVLTKASFTSVGILRDDREHTSTLYLRNAGR